MSRIFTIGETLLDIIFKDRQPVSATPGGSMLNTAVSLGRLGAPVHFVSDYGNDMVGRMIDAFLEDNGVDTFFVRRYEKHLSGLALAFLDESGNASYQFYKDFPSERMDKVRISFREDDILLFGSFFAITGQVREALIRFLHAAREAGALIIYDPNFRKPHLSELDHLKPLILENIAFADIVRGSDEDFELIFGENTFEGAYLAVQNAGCENLFYTMNREGVRIHSSHADLHINAPAVEPVSTIGAGDNFNAGLIWTLLDQRITRHDLSSLPVTDWKKAGEQGISFATSVCLHYENYISHNFAEKMKTTSQKG